MPPPRSKRAALRVVVDVNVLISFLIGRRLGGFVAALRQNDFVLLVSSELLAELLDVTARPKFREHFPVEFAHQLVLALAEAGEFVEVRSIGQTPLSRDPKDDYLLLMARKGKAHVLITGDGDLLELEHFGRTRILPPRSFTDEFLR